MDAKKVREAFERGAAKAARRRAAGAGHGAHPARRRADVHRGAGASSPVELEGAWRGDLGIPSRASSCSTPQPTRRPVPPGADGSIYYRSGADAGPDAIRRHSVFYSLRHGARFRAEADPDLVILDHLRVVDYGNVTVVPDDVEETFPARHAKLADILAAGACRSSSAATTRSHPGSPGALRQAQRQAWGRRVRLSL